MHLKYAKYIERLCVCRIYMILRKHMENKFQLMQINMLATYSLYVFTGIVNLKQAELWIQIHGSYENTIHEKGRRRM